jgi:HTH-type transcriptional regulator, sugar sensing transcriptional regulator
MLKNTNHIIESLLDIGMSEREARVYLALLKKRYAAAADLQRISGVPQSKIYETIGGLVRQGLCIERKVGRKRTFEITDPAVTLENSFGRLEERLNKALKQKMEIINLYQKADSGAEPLEYVEIIRGNDIIHQHYCQLVHNTEFELLGFGRGPYACDTSPKLNEQNQEQWGLIKRGGISRWVFEVSPSDNSWIVPQMSLMQERGQRHRISEHLPLKMMIFDRKTVLVAQEDQLYPTGELTMSIIKHNAVAGAFIALFEYFWSSSLELDSWAAKKAAS